MENNRSSNPSSEIRKTRFTMLKKQQCSLNMQIRLAMQLHNAQAQADLEEELKKIMDEIDRVT